MSHYKIIHDREELEKFIEYLNPMSDNWVYYFSLFARKKYAPELVNASDRSQLRRFACTKDRIINRIEQCELKLGTWKLKDRDVPQKSLVLYMHPNPRCLKIATMKMGAKCWQMMRDNFFNVAAQAKSCIHKAKAKTIFVTFDIDEKDIEVEKLDKMVNSIIPKLSYKIITTHGGYHILVRPDLACFSFQNSGKEIKELINDNNNKWHPQLRELFGDKIDQVGDLLSPVPGTIQGGHVPKMI